MTGFEVWLNGNRLCTAGVEAGNSTVVVTHVESTKWQRAKGLPPETNISVGGAEAETGGHLNWANHSLLPGDEIIIRVVKDFIVSPVLARSTADPELEREQIERYVEKMTAQLGWKLTKPDEK